MSEKIPGGDGAYYSIKELLERRDQEHRERWERVERKIDALDLKLSLKADAISVTDVRVLAELNRDRLNDVEEALSVLNAGRKATIGLWTMAILFVGTLSGLVVLVLDRA